MTLKTGSQQNIIDMFTELKSGIKVLLQSVTELVYFMRGAISYDEIMSCTYMERQIFSEFIAARLKATKGLE